MPLPRSRPDRPRGLTLLELVVVLSILAVLALVAVKSLEPVADQARYEATVRTLTNVEEAILGSPDMRQPDGTPLISGFVADIGRLPRIVGGDPKTQLAELWDASLWSTYAFGMRAGPDLPTDYSDIKLPCGWRGPYLRLGVGLTDVRDGWSEAFQLAPGTDGSPLVSITWQPVTPYVDALVIPATGTFAGATGGGLVTVSGTVTDNGTVPSSATVVLLYPVPGQTTLEVMPDTDGSADAFVFANVPIGLRAIRATMGAHIVTKYVYVPRNGLPLTLNYTPP